MRSHLVIRDIHSLKHVVTLLVENLNEIDLEFRAVLS